MRYLTQAEHFKAVFGSRVQKLSVDGGFTCPNRDGHTGSIEGCTFCRNDAFNPAYCRRSGSITKQIEEGIAFHRHRYRNAPKYLTYLQAYSNTYAPVEVLRQRYGEALRHPDVVGMVVGTRPDCVGEEVLDLLCELAKDSYVAVEYGIESVYDRTLQLVNRGHDFACLRHAVEATAGRGLPVGGHIIIGLPGESRGDILAGIATINSLPLTSIKLHQLQILKDTPMERQYTADPKFRKSLLMPSLQEYVELVADIVERLRPDMVVERLAGEVPPRYQAFPELSFRRPDGQPLRNEEFPALVETELERRGTRQGSRLNNN